MSYETIFAEIFQKDIGRILHDSISNDQYKIEIINHVKATGERIYDTEPGQFTGDILINLVKTLIESIAVNQKAVDRTEFLSVLDDYEKVILVRFCRDKMDFAQIAYELHDSEEEISRLYAHAAYTVNNAYMESVQGSALTPAGLLYALDLNYTLPKAVRPQRSEAVQYKDAAPTTPKLQAAPNGFRRAGSLEIEPLPFTPQTPGLTYHPTNSNSLRIKGDTGRSVRTPEIQTGDNSYMYTPAYRQPEPVQKRSSTVMILLVVFLAVIFVVFLIIVIAA